MEQVYGTMIQQMPNDFDLNQYIQIVEFKKYDLKKRGQNIKITVYEMFRNNSDVKEISQKTGFSINEILETINEIDPLMYFAMKQDNDEFDKDNNVKTR